MLGKKVLVVNDSNDLVQMLRTLLEFEGFTVVTAKDGLAGLIVASVESPDLLITDIEMPELGGIEMIERLRERAEFATVPILVLSACDRRTLRKAIKAGANHALREPVGIDLIVSTVKNLLQPSLKHASNTKSG